jgi:nucleotide-binding universal stress UspA family protein
VSTRFLVFVAVTWAVIGLIVAFVMRRRGHDFSVWLVLGVALGPLVVPLAIERVRYHGAAEYRPRVIPTSPHVGFDVLGGLDGSDEAFRAIETALKLFGGRVSSVTVATVLDFDSESSTSGLESQTAANAMLAGIAENLEYDPVDTKILFGRADKALSEHARTSGMELIVVGARGHGATEALFGSVTSRLVGSSEVPVFVGPAGSGIEWGAAMRGDERSWVR